MSLTQTGREIESRVNQAWRKVEEISTKGLNDKEKAQFVALAKKIATTLKS
ncbi:hypothetical protein [Paenibacillus antibioticophila]|uniref:hypothetical protein n=1 Tax=Paenibacillus antibioticophila TaxID=1274374 RepID=UPI000B153C56|nr:hypothetical protein [Paenibacillus antibioticophila]